MSKKSERVTFRTTEECTKHCKAVSDRYDLPVSDIIHRMINYWAKDGDVEKTFKDLMG
jgi:antitoxin component of RelBE/YafQ-DinJ toxin-antitoxin module